MGVGDALPWRGRPAGPYPLSLAIEMMAQAALAILSESLAEDEKGRSVYLAGVSRARWVAQLAAGDRVSARAERLGSYGALVKVACALERGQERVAEAELLLALA